MNTDSTRYIGRFAPSPTGPLHLGSMLTALASYLDAKSNDGRWLVRIDDLDPPRTVQGADQQILNALEKFHLEWDGEVAYQSQRHSYYEKYLRQSIYLNLAYPCNCTRQQILSAGGIYPGTCLKTPPPNDKPYATRAKSPQPSIIFNDRCQGLVEQNINSEIGDFVIKRKDGLFAYHLACAVDDHLQGVTHIVRGLDLMDSTPRQIHLQNIFNFETPKYLHLPIITNDKDQKLSKQTHAPDISQMPTNETTYKLLSALGLRPPKSTKHNLTSMLAWGTEHWAIDAIPNKQTIRESSL